MLVYLPPFYVLIVECFLVHLSAPDADCQRSFPASNTGTNTNMRDLSVAFYRTLHS